MASGDHHHGKTNVVYQFNPADYGPFNVLDGDHFNNFTGGSYYMTTPKEDNIMLYRLYGGNATAEGQHWTLEPRKGNDGYRHDAAVLKPWNTLEHAVELIVPRGVHMYEGFVGRQKGYLGGGWQVFIPREVVKSV
ncbi:hypothetical protein DPMN_051527 [Dreissena polymorpha]|uniref:Uncharacterized protein n=1 Tax=Dreissena polymorpha TaxID=45954 RepID=A0A9D4CJL9_DREPO|nr:hypothetical protein DPMN_051527 [Dreissena polymorpha]